MKKNQDCFLLNKSSWWWTPSEFHQKCWARHRRLPEWRTNTPSQSHRQGSPEICSSLWQWWNVAMLKRSPPTESRMLSSVPRPGTGLEPWLSHGQVICHNFWPSVETYEKYIEKHMETYGHSQHMETYGFHGWRHWEVQPWPSSSWSVDFLSWSVLRIPAAKPGLG